MTLWTDTHKALAVIAVLLLNIFFVVFAISRAIERGVGWQKAFIAASTVQMFIEIFIYETMECIWMQFIIPSSIRSGTFLSID